MSGSAGIIGSPVRRARAIVTRLGVARLLLTGLMLLGALMIARYSWSLVGTSNAEGILYDARAVLTAPVVDQDDRMILVVYDEDTLRQTGKRSPVDRATLAKALTRLDAMGAKGIGIDILIDQPQPDDPALIAAFQGMKTPTWLAYASNATANSKISYEQQGFLDGFMKQLAPGNVRPASIQLKAEQDNVLRRWPPREAAQPPTLANAIARHTGPFAGFAGSIRYRTPRDAERDVLSVLPIQTFSDDANFISIDTVEGLAALIKDRYVLIGGHITDTDLFDTPLGKRGARPVWGLDIFATMLAQQLDGALYMPIPPWTLWAAAILIVVAGAGTALSDLRPLTTLAVLAPQFAAIGYLPVWLHGAMIETYDLPQFGWGAGWIAAFVAAGSASRAVNAEQRKFAQSALGKYLPRDIAAEILRDPEGLKLHGEKREIFVIFTDLEGFTKLSHAIAPEMVATLLNTYLETLSNVVLDHGGTIDKFVGDAVVAFWGAPISRPDDGERAARAAVAMYRAGEHFRQNVPDGVPAIGRTRVGLHHGDAIVGNFGGEGRIQYTALGDSMNTASRLESANKQLKSTMLASREAVELSGLDWWRPLGRVELRGRATPIDVYEAVPDMAEADRMVFDTLVPRAVAGDEAARTDLANIASLHPEDAALRNLLYRLEHQSAGGYFVLD